MKKKVLYDILFYLIIPLSIWNFGRIKLGDYYAMLLTTAPGLIYTIYNLLKDRQYNVTGIYILVSLILGRTLDIIANSAEEMLWNGVYIDILSAIFITVTVIIKKPIVMYFFIDYANIQGYPRERSKKLYNKKGVFMYFQYLAGLFVLNHVEEVFLKIWLIGKYGVEGFNQISVLMSVNNYVFAGLKIVFILFMVNRIKQIYKVK